MANEGPVAIFWDLDKLPPPSSSTAYEAVDTITRIAHDYGVVKSFNAYSDNSELLGRGTLRSDMRVAGVLLNDCPQDGTKGNTISVDMMAYGMDHPAPAALIIISDDYQLAYVASILRLRKYRIIVIAPSSAHRSIRIRASGWVDWNGLMEDVLKDQTQTLDGSGTGASDSTRGGLPPEGALMTPTSISLSVDDIVGQAPATESQESQLSSSPEQPSLNTTAAVQPLPSSDDDVVVFHLPDILQSPSTLNLEDLSSVSPAISASNHSFDSTPSSPGGSPTSEHSVTHAHDTVTPQIESNIQSQGLQFAASPKPHIVANSSNPIAPDHLLGADTHWKEAEDVIGNRAEGSQSRVRRSRSLSLSSRPLQYDIETPEPPIVDSNDAPSTASLRNDRDHSVDSEAQASCLTSVPTTPEAPAVVEWLDGPAVTQIPSPSPSPSPPRHALFQGLIDELQHHPDDPHCRSTVALGLMKRDPNAYKRASVSNFKGFIALAVAAGVVSEAKHRTERGKSADTLSLTPAWQLATQPEPFPTSTRLISPPNPVSTPSDPLLFQNLVEEIKRWPIPRPLRLAVATRLIERHPMSYAQAGVTNFDEYFIRAMEAGVVSLGESILADGRVTQWVSLSNVQTVKHATTSTNPLPSASRADTSSNILSPAIKFGGLIEMLRRQEEVYVDYVTAAVGLMEHDPLAYTKAGITSNNFGCFERYIILAEEAGIITLCEGPDKQGKSTELVSLNPAWRVPDDSDSNLSSTALGPGVTPSQGQSASGTEFFALLLERLREMRDNNVSRPYRWTVHMDLIGRNPSIYDDADVADFDEYAYLAEYAGLVTLGGEGNRQWISLA